MLRKQLYSFLITLVFLLTASTVMAASSVVINAPTDGATITTPTTPISGIASHTGQSTQNLLDIVLVVDNSGSMSSTDGDGVSRIAEVNQALTSLLGNFDSSYINVGYVSFGRSYSDNGTVRQSLTNDYTAVQDAIDDGVASWGTPMSGGIAAGAAELAANGRSGADQMILLLSDGYPNSTSATDAAAQALSGTDIEMNTFGFGNPNDTLMTNIAGYTGGTYTKVDSTNIDTMFDPPAGGGTALTLDSMTVTDGTNTWDATVTAKIGDNWLWETTGFVNPVGSTTYTAAATWSDAAYADASVTINNAGAPVPEPATMFLLGIGLIGLIGINKRKVKR